MCAIPVNDIWLYQFNQHSDDHKLAKLLYEKIRYINNSDLKSLIANKLSLYQFKSTPSAIFIERELPKTKSPHPPLMYKETKIKIPGRLKHKRRATGAALQAVSSLTYKRQEIGSEGILGQYLSSYCKKHPNEFMFHPTAEEIRKYKARKIIIVTDFIGSGERMLRMLDSIWRVRSVRSWTSYKFIKIIVICVSGTKGGMAIVRKHPSRPEVVFSIECPTIYNSFDTNDILIMKDLCERYGKFDQHPLGYKNTAALIAFEHSAPNNLPAIFIKSNSRKNSLWRPIFINRNTEKIWDVVVDIERNMKNAFESLELYQIFASKTYKREPLAIQQSILITAALWKNHRNLNSLISITNIPLKSFDEALSYAIKKRWITPNRRITRKGRLEMSRFALEGTMSPVANRPQIEYYPSQLRAPF